ncbi:ATP-binding protein [Fulvimarina sp. MAC3]|uniref:sensor histidine kinase n=1 Tax=Fulvimarina sp. MAC3 TaxID=3148887 RepID=UPI0031FCF76F
MRSWNNLILRTLTAGGVLLIASVGTTIWALDRSQDLSDRVMDVMEDQIAINQYHISAEQIETARRGYILSRDDRYLPLIAKLREKVVQNEKTLSNTFEKNEVPTDKLSLLEPQTAKLLQLVQKTVNEVKSGAADISYSYDRATQPIVQVREIVDALAAREQVALQNEIDMHKGAHEIAFVIVGLCALLLVFMTIFVVWVTRRNLIALRETTDELARLNDHLETAVADRTVELRRANDEIQRFAYIVSHDLRSPLVNVMGFTSEMDAGVTSLTAMLDRVEAQAPDLVTNDDKFALREDFPEAIRFIRASTQKMDRLINAILRLSREGRRRMTPEDIDMNELVSGIVGSLQHRLSEIGGTVEIEDLPSVRSDRVGLEQILSNLIENAMKYRHPERPLIVRVRGRREDPRTVFEVSDNGRGIDPKDHDRIFDLFRRSGLQDQPGEGIGLAHVRAIAYRLGGVITCVSALDEGATFSLSVATELSEYEGKPA